MHLADGILNLPTLIGSAAGAAAGLAIGFRQLTPKTLPSAALFAAVFFIVGTLHVPIGIGSVHLILNGLIGLLLGWLAFPVIFVALVLQALLFSFGGFAVLGANLLLLAAPAVVAHYALRSTIVESLHSQRRLMLLGLCAATIGIGGASIIAMTMLWSTGQQELLNLVVLFGVAQLPVWLVDATISALVVAALGRTLPSVFQK